MAKAKRDHAHADQANADDDSYFDASDGVINMRAQEALKQLIERIERLNEDKAAIMADLKEVFAEAKGNGFDVKILRKVIRIRAMDSGKRSEEEALIDLYLTAIGGL